VIVNGFKKPYLQNNLLFRKRIEKINKDDLKDELIKRDFDRNRMFLEDVLKSLTQIKYLTDQ
jgi:hypothetical protein